MEVVWRGPDELRAMPAELVAIEGGGMPVWRLRPLGPATRGQRRAWIRAPMALPVRLMPPTGEITGTTVDVSEGGLRIVLDPHQPAATDAPTAGPERSDPGGEGDGEDEPMAAGAVVPLSLTLDEAKIPCRVDVLRRIRRDDDRWELTLRFVGMHDKTQDFIRRHVFTGLRLLRARELL